MLTIEIKEKIFALYWSQTIMGNTKSENGILQDVLPDLGKHDNFYLLVKPLSQISDEDGIAICKILYNEEKYQKAEFGVYAVEHYILSKEYDCNLPFTTVSCVIDYLRSRGYALCAYGYSVEELVKEGIFKLKD